MEHQPPFAQMEQFLSGGFPKGKNTQCGQKTWRDAADVVFKLIVKFTGKHRKPRNH